jgi:hypothetical protein
MASLVAGLATDVLDLFKQTLSVHSTAITNDPTRGRLEGEGALLFSTPCSVQDVRSIQGRGSRSVDGIKSELIETQIVFAYDARVDPASATFVKDLIFKVGTQRYYLLADPIDLAGQGELHKLLVSKTRR